MKPYIIPILDILFIYLVYHIMPWPTFVTIYGSIVLITQLILILYVFLRFDRCLQIQFTKPIISTFIIYSITILLYLTSEHTIAHILALSTTVSFYLLYYIRYKANQLF